MAQNVVADFAPPRTPLGSFQRSPDSLAGFGAARLRGREGRSRKEEGKNREKADGWGTRNDTE